MKIASKIIMIIIIILNSLLLLSYLIAASRGVVNAGNIFGIGFNVFVYLSVFLWNRQGTVFKGAVLAIAAGLLLNFALSSALVLSYSMKRPDSSYKTIVVLGCKVKGDEPSRMLHQRIMAARDAYLDDPERMIIGTGGQGIDEEIPEGECIRNTLIALGVPEENIIAETKSTNTLENLLYSKEIINSSDKFQNKDKIIIATNRFHMFRSVSLGRQAGFICSSASANSTPYVVSTMMTREMLSIDKFALESLIRSLKK